MGCITTFNFCFYLQNRLIQTGQTGGQLYSGTSFPPLVFPALTVKVVTLFKLKAAAELFFGHSFHWGALSTQLSYHFSLVFVANTPLSFLTIRIGSMEQHALKNLNNCLNTYIYSYLETSGGQNSNIYSNVDFSNTSV
jgi:hypothetical protein